MATGKLRRQREEVRHGRHEYRFGGHHRGSERHTAAVVLFSLLFLACSATASAQDEGTVAPSPAPGPPSPAPPEAAEEEEEVVEEERRVRPFFLPEPSLTERLLPDASPDFGSSLLFPPNALEGVRRPGRLLQVGRFAISPSIALAATYDDNVSASDTDREDDITGNIAAGVQADSLFERHSLGFGVNASVGNPHENFEGSTTDRISFNSRADGRLDLTRRSSVTAEAGFARGAQSPEVQEAGAEEEPTVYTATGALAYRQSFARLGWQIAGGINRTEADDGDDAAEQDRTGYSVSPGVDYQLSRRLSVFADSAYSINHYDQSGEGGSRDSQAVRAGVGTDLDFGRTFSARMGVGYVGVFFDDSERDDHHSPTLIADLNGAISLDRLTVLGLGLNHSTDLTTADDAALVTRTRFSTSINRLLTPASAILARVGLSRSDFVDESRTDHDITAELAYSHTLFQSIAMNLSYRFSKRFADEDENEFYRNLVSVGLSASF